MARTKKATHVLYVQHRDEQKQEMNRGTLEAMQHEAMLNYNIGLGYRKGYQNADGDYILFVPETDMTGTCFFVRKVAK